MKKLLSVISLTLLVFCATGSMAGPEPVVAPAKVQVGAWGSWGKTVTFKGGERANVIVVGDGSSHLGIYIFDGHGNCITRDDAPGGKYLDDRWVIWQPAQTQAYTIEVRNLGASADVFRIAIR